MDYVTNLRDRPIVDFLPGDTLYVRKQERGFPVTYFCEFIQFSRGIVTAKVREGGGHKWSSPKPGGTITARLASCFLWGRRDNDIVRHEHCQWFNSKDKPAGVN